MPRSHTVSNDYEPPEFPARAGEPQTSHEAVSTADTSSPYELPAVGKSQPTAPDDEASLPDFTPSDCPAPSHRPGPSLFSLIATHNPFYAAATALVFYGVRISFPPGAHPHYSALLAGSLAGFVGLLVGAALFLRRIRARWEDLRMVALLVVVMLPGISITFDDHLVDDLRSGTCYGIGGALFAALVSEVLLRGLRVRLPAGYRVPYHLLLASFYLYPLLVRRFADAPDDPRLTWAMYGYAPLVCVILLACLPAVARGNRYVSQNGTPWGWPLYPTSIFVLLSVCAAGRAYYVCRSFHFVGDHEGIFAPHFLNPLLMAAAAWCAVGGIRSGNRSAQLAALFLPIAAVVLATVAPERDYVFNQFLRRYQEAFGALPPLMTISVAAAFYAILWACRVRSAAVLFLAALLWSAMVGPNSRSALDFGPVRPAPLAIAALCASIRAYNNKDDLFWPGCAVGCWWLAALAAARQYPGVPVAFVGYHAALALLVAGAICLGRERGKPLGLIAALMIVSAGLHALEPGKPILFNGLPRTVVDWYPLPLSVLAFTHAWGMRDVTMNRAAMIVAFFAAYVRARPYARGLDFITAGLACLAIAVWVSYLKAKRGDASEHPVVRAGESTG
jgi:hypothetical protein